MAASPEDSVITLEYRGRVALLTIDNERKLNALSQPQYYDLGQKLREIATHDEVFVTVLTAKGRYFSAGADVTAARDAGATGAASHKTWLTVFSSNLTTTHAFYTHPKILVVGLNGPVVGLSAALISMADFIYCTPSAFLLTPFSSLGLVAEGGASRALVQRLGIARANEALIMSRRIGAEELKRAGFVNEIFDCGSSSSSSGGGGSKREDERFRDRLLEEVDDRLGEHLIGDSLVGIKALIRRPEMDVMDRQNSLEMYAGIERFMKGVPQEEFRKIASREKRHKL